MNKEEWERKYLDTHKGMSVSGQLRKNKISPIKHPSDKNAKAVKIVKGPIEKRALQERSEDFQNFLLDTVEVRASEAIDPEKLPVKDLLKIAAGTVPKQLNVDQNINHTFASLWDDVDVTEDSEVEAEEAQLVEEEPESETNGN